MYYWSFSLPINVKSIAFKSCPFFLNDNLILAEKGIRRGLGAGSYNKVENDNFLLIYPSSSSICLVDFAWCCVVTAGPHWLLVPVETCHCQSSHTNTATSLSVVLTEPSQGLGSDQKRGEGGCHDDIISLADSGLQWTKCI